MSLHVSGHLSGDEEVALLAPTHQKLPSGIALDKLDNPLPTFTANAASKPFDRR